MKFLKLEQSEVASIANDPTVLYTPVVNGEDNLLYIDEEPLATAQTVTLTQTQLFGLTPINPQKPMFPKR